MRRSLSGWPVWLGDIDRTTPFEQADMLMLLVAQGRTVIIPDGSHAPDMSDPATFHEELLRFLGDLPESRMRPCVSRRCGYWAIGCDALRAARDDSALEAKPAADFG